MALYAKPEPDFIHTFPDILAPFVPTPPDVVERMLLLAGTGGDDFVFDLGSGDGRILIAAAAKYGAKGFGVDVVPYWINEAEEKAKESGVDHLVSFKLQDAATVDLSPASIIMLYLVQWSNDRMKQRILSQTKPGTRIVSHTFHLTDWAPKKVEEFADSEGVQRRLFLWVKE